MKWSYILPAASVALVLSAVPGEAQQRYEPWRNPDGSQQSSSQLDELLGKLNGLIDNAERDRAANPRFLRDLRDLTHEYKPRSGVQRDWPVVLLDDDFSDGDYQRNPVWQVSGGRYWIEKSYGLRGSRSQSNQNQQSSSNDSNRNSNEDVAAQIFGSILNQALGGGQNQQRQSNTANTQSALAVISTDTPISNAFSMRLELTSWKNEGEFFMGPYQGARRDAGYRLVYKVGQVPSLQMLRVSSRGTTVIGSYNRALKLEDQRPHVVKWTRDRNGAMVVEVDDRELIRVNDQGFRDRFNGFKMANGGGDYIVRRITIHGNR